MPALTEMAAAPPTLHPRRLREPGYGRVLILIVVSLAFQLAAPDEAWSRLITIALQGATLLETLRASRVHRWIYRAAIAVFVAALLGSLAVFVGSEGELGQVSARAIGLLLVAVVPPAIVIGTVREFRVKRTITIQTMFGVLCVYLLLGALFAFGYGLAAELDDGHFFASGAAEDQADFLYFSFSTLTTTGYGDLTAATGLGRSLSITEALVGQIYLVTVVALIVGNLGRSRTAARDG